MQNKTESKRSHAATTASSSSSSQSFLKRRARKRIRCERRLAISPLIPSPLLRDAITAVDEIVREEHQRLKLHDLVSDDDDDSDNDDMQQQQQQVGFIGRSKRHRRNSCALTSSDTSQESLSSAIMLNSLSLCDTFLRIQSPLPTVTTTTTSSQRTSSPSSARRVSDEDLQISTLFNAATLS
mmetsp:Transcript_26365/g.35120  ORF Transcript_26365/g.35120 Transcript_26365/m.35120 type:complete len:182 (+) Transcript_26365:246-791(+)